MKFHQLGQYLNKLENTTSRIEITKILANLFKESEKKEVDKITYLLLGRLAPNYRSIVFNIADRMMIQILADAYDEKTEIVKELYKNKGDLGAIVNDLAKKDVKKIRKEQTIMGVYDCLVGIAKDEGEGSQERKVKASAELLSKLDPLSAKFVVRIILGKLRLGFSDKTVLDALSWMETGDKSKKVQLERAYNVFPDVGFLAKEVKTRGINKATAGVSPLVGTPVQPALAQRLKSPKEMIKKMKEVVVEPKFDGLRIQIHLKRGRGGFIKAFTRNLNETSWMFPELEEAIGQVNADEVILDSEGIGVDEKRKSLANFQQTMTRRRKHDIEKIASRVAIKFYVFDILLKDGVSLVNKSYIERRKELEKTIRGDGVLEMVDYVLTTDAKKIENRMSKYINEGLEGIIVKRANSKYVAGRTGWRWVKMKEEENAKAKLADTIDCVVMGYFTGKGKRTKFGVGGFLVGILKKDEVLTLTKIGTGLTDEQFRELKKRLSGVEVKKKPKEYAGLDKTLIPDVWVSPLLIVEIAADEITKSPKHSSGYALRFPRLVRFRDDKSWNQATTIIELKKIFALQ